MIKYLAAVPEKRLREGFYIPFLLFLLFIPEYWHRCYIQKEVQVTQGKKVPLKRSLKAQLPVASYEAVPENGRVFRITK